MRHGTSALPLVTVVALGFCINGPVYGSDFTGLGFLQSGELADSVAYDISADGSTVVGFSRDAEGRSQAIRWTDAGGMQGLGFLTGGRGSSAFAVSSDGSVIVGGSELNDPDARRQAFRWTLADGIQALDYLPGSDIYGYNEARDISAAGAVIAGFNNSQPGTQAVTWQDGVGVALLPGLPGAPHVADAHAVSGDGAVVTGTAASGEVPGRTIFEAAYWLNGGVPVFLGAGENSAAWAVSSDGSTIVGQFFDWDLNQYHAFRWTASGGLSALPDLLEGSTTSMVALAVSADGSIVVGTSSVNGVAQAFVWDVHSGMRSLADVLAGVESAQDWQLIVARAISADGRFVAGYGVNPNSRREAFVADLRPDVDELLQQLFADVTGVGPGKKLANTVKLAQTYYAARDIPATCAVLADFVFTVQSLASGRKPKLSPSIASELISDAEAITAAIGCN